MTFARTTAVAGAGTVSCTGTTTVTGSGTAFAFAIGGAPATNAPRIGGTITVGGVTKTITAITSATSLTTDTAFGTFSGQAFTCQTGVIQTGTDTMSLGLGEITGFLVTNRADLYRTFDVRGQDFFIEGTLTVDSRVAQLRNDGSCSNRFEVRGSASGGEIIINGRKATAANAPFPYPGFDWLGQNGQKVMRLVSTNASFPAKFTIIDACIRYGADWITTDLNNFSRITTQGDVCWILGARGTGTSQARLRQDNTTASIDFQANKTFVGVWLNFGVPQLSLTGYTPIDTDGPEVNVGPVAVATKVTVSDYNSTYVFPSYYANAQWTQLGGAYVELRDNLKGTDMNWFSQSISGGIANVMVWSKTITIKAQDTAGNLLSDGYMYYQPVGANVANIRPKGNTTGVTFDLTQQTAVTVDGAATSIFNFAWDFSTTGGLQNSFLYFCTGTTKGAETHVVNSSRYGYDKQSVTVSLVGNGATTPTFVHTSLPTTDKVIANAAAITGVTFNFVTKVMDVSAALDPQKIYDAYQYAGNLIANLKYNDDCAIIGERTSYTGWTVNVLSGGSIGSSATFKEFGAALVNISAGGAITIPYQDASGLRVTVTGLDPDAFGITWFLRHRPTGGSTWTNVSGTGNTALILLAEGAYDVQVRAPGYDWASALSLNTAESLSLNAGLRYQVSANNTPQYTMAFDAALEAIFQYDATAMKVSVANTTAGILQPGFAELYQATQRIQHIPGLVWTWTAPVTANATSQKILIPAGNPISMFLTDASTNTVKITCPVIHADTGQSADDRVRGNPSGYSIILGSPATAESAGLATQIISGLGGAGYVEAEASQAAIKTLIDQVQTLVEQVKARTDLVPDAPAAVGSAMTLTGDYDAAKTAATQASVDALATATGTPLQASAYTAPPTPATVATAVRTELAPELARIDVAISTRSTLTPSQIPEGLTAAQVWGHSTRTLTEGAGITAAEVWAHSTRTLTEDVGLTPTQAVQLANIHTWTDALPTLTDIEGSTALAMQATSLAIKAKTDALQNPDLSGLATSAQLTPLATAAQVGTLATATQVQALAEAAGTPLQAGDYTAPPAPATVAAAVRTELATELARIDAPTTSRLADAAYTAPDNATALQTKQIAIEIQTRVDAALGAPN